MDIQDERPMMAIIADNIRRRRKQLRLSQKELSLRLGKARQQVYRWENEQTEPEFGTLKLIAKALEVPGVEYFYEDRRGQFQQPEVAELAEVVDIVATGAGEEETISIPQSWAKKFVAMYRGMAAINPGIEPLPDILTQLQRRRAQGSATLEIPLVAAPRSYDWPGKTPRPKTRTGT